MVAQVSNKKVSFKNKVLGKTKELGMSVDEVAFLLGVSKATFYRLLGNPDSLNRLQLKVISKYLDIPISEILHLKWCILVKFILFILTKNIAEDKI